MVRVRWVDGTESVKEANHLQNFDALIEDHKRKYEKHLEMKKKIEEIWHTRTIAGLDNSVYW